LSLFFTIKRTTGEVERGDGSKREEAREAKWKK
jgi:hypothetical protein